MISVALISTLATWASDLSTGINAQLLALPAFTPPVPPPVTVLTSYDDEDIAQGMLDDLRLASGPFFVLAPSAKQSIGGVFADGTDDLNEVVAMYTDGRSDSRVALRHAAVTMRAWRRVLALQFNLRSNAGLEIDGCFVSRPERIVVQTGTPALGSAQVAMAVFMPFPVLDSWALGAPAP